MLADRLVSQGVSKTRVRKVFQSIAFLTPAVALQILANPSISPRAAVTCLTFALGVTSLGELHNLNGIPAVCSPDIHLLG